MAILFSLKLILSLRTPETFPQITVCTAKEQKFSFIVDASIVHVSLICVDVKSLTHVPQSEDSPY